MDHRKRSTSRDSTHNDKAHRSGSNNNTDAAGRGSRSTSTSSNNRTIAAGVETAAGGNTGGRSFSTSSNERKPFVARKETISNYVNDVPTTSGSRGRASSQNKSGHTSRNPSASSTTFSLQGLPETLKKKGVRAGKNKTT